MASPSAVVLSALAADFAAMAPHLARQQPDSVQRDLTHAAAPHAMLIAGKWVDLGDRRQARRWWAKARELSDQSGDRLLASWLRGREALYRQGDPTENLAEVLAIAREAQRLAGNRPSAPLVSALAAEAQILALLGRYNEAVEALRRAEGMFDQMPTATIIDPNWARREEGLVRQEPDLLTRG